MTSKSPPTRISLNPTLSVMHQRWYESNDSLRAALAMLKDQPTADACRLMEHVIRVSEHYPRAYTNETPGVKQLGWQRVRSLLMSQHRRRWYDEEPTIHRAMRLIHLMVEPAQEDIGQKLLLCGYILDLSQKNKLPAYIQSRPALMQQLFQDVFDRQTLGRPRSIEILTQDILKLLHPSDPPGPSSLAYQEDGFRLQPKNTD